MKERATPLSGRLRLLSTALLVLLLSACAADAPQDVLRPEGPISRTQDRLWDITFFVAVVVFVIVEGALVYALIRYRRRPGREAADFHGNTRVEVVLTVVPALILAALAVPTVKTIFDLSARPTGDVLEVTVTGHQFWWRYEYPQFKVTTANELHIPVGRPIYITIKGADVIHSFWVPRLGGKQDVVPGRINYLTLRADKPGAYMGQCTEFCGLSHANMRLRVIAHTEQDFRDWVAEQQLPAAPAQGDLEVQGEKLFLEGQCVNCHAVLGTEAAGQSGPDLTHFASRQTFAGAMFVNNAENLAAWIRDPSAVKPGAQMPDYGHTDAEIRALVAYLMTLK